MAFQFTQTGQELQYLADEAEKIAAEYDAAASWATGDYCTHEGTIYRCTASTTGTFDASSWTAVILCDELEGLRTRMSTAEGNIQTNADDISALNTVLTQSNLVNQTAGRTLTLAVEVAAVATVTNRIDANVHFPFIAKNLNYTVSLSRVLVQGIDYYTSVATVGQKYYTGFRVQIPGTWTRYNGFSVAVDYTITFA